MRTRAVHPIGRALLTSAGLLIASGPALCQVAQEHLHLDAPAPTPASLTTRNTTRLAWSQAMPGLNDAERAQFNRGSALERTEWVISPSLHEDIDGLGPLYNRISCAACHPKNGRGQPPQTPQQRMQSMLVRLSVAGADAHGGPKPHPAYGGQLNEEGIAGVPGEGRVAIHWEEQPPVTLAGGEQVRLRSPRLEFVEMAYGPTDGLLTSPRVGPVVYGLGLLDAVPAQTLQAMADEQKPDGVRGRINMVWSTLEQRMMPGRMGLKANKPNLRDQIASAMVGDMGITSSLYPQEECAPKQRTCLKVASNGAPPELSDQQLDDLEFFLAHLAVPARRDVDDPQVQKGMALFVGSGCVLCHRPGLGTGEHPRFPRLSRQTVDPWSDLLIHDMGEGLSDGRPDFDASGSEWRTPPLWGIGLTETVNGHSFFLHDGRARNLSEAIVWHGGEAQAARDRFVAMPPEDRAALLRFLQSL